MAKHLSSLRKGPEFQPQHLSNRHPPKKKEIGGVSPSTWFYFFQDCFGSIGSEMNKMSYCIRDSFLYKTVMVDLQTCSPVTTNRGFDNNQWFPTVDNFVPPFPPGDICQCLEIFCVGRRGLLPASSG